jgi:hypothetical protein
MSRARTALFGLALAFLSISAVLRFGLTRDASDLDQHQLYAGSDPWAVQKVRPGDRLTQHQARLGAPEKDLVSNGGRVIQWTSPSQLTLAVNEDGEIVEAWGRSLTAGDSTLIDTGLSEAEVTRILGRGKVQKSTRPSGSGVISLGRVEISRTMTYDDREVRFEITLEEDQVKHVRAVKITQGR